MSKICKGCGVTLQYTDKQQIGYTPKEGAEYCQRCFRIQHYDDVTISMKQGIDSDAVLKKIAEKDALILWVVDLFDFEANLVPGLNRHLLGKDIIMVATKRDLLPDTLGNQKLSQFLISRLKENGINIEGLIICGDLAKHAMAEDNYSIDEVEHALSLYRKGRDVVVMGMANAGKSTLLNAFLGRNDLTTSRYPGTTLDLVPIDMKEYTLYDTPGLTRHDSLLTLVDEAVLKSVLPAKRLKARNYQLRKDQSLAVGGLARLDIAGCENVSCVGYFADALNIHRGKMEKADELWKMHMGELLKPAMSQDFQDMKCFEHPGMDGKLDVVVHGLGWFCISGHVDSVRIYVPKGVNVTFRKAMI